MKSAAVFFVAFAAIFVGTLLIVNGVMTTPYSVYPNTQHMSTIPYPISERR